MLQFIIIVIVCGAVLYLINAAPIDDFIKLLVKVVICVVLLVYAIKLFFPALGIG